MVDITPWEQNINTTVHGELQELTDTAVAEGAASRQAEVDALEREVALIRAQYNALDAEYAAHLDLPAPAGHLVIPPPAPHTVLLGGSYGGADESLYLGRAKVARCFFTGNLPADWWNNQYVQQAYNDGVRTFIVSWKGTQVGATIATNLANRPSDVVIYGCYYHEPEDNIEGGSLTLATWKNRHVEHASAMRTAGVTPVGIFMQYTLVTSRRNIMDYACGDEGVLFDFYMNAVENKVNPEAAVTRMVEAAADMGAKFTGTAETGVNMNGTPKDQAIELTKRARAALVAEPTVALGTWWSTDEFKFIPETADAWFNAPS